MYYDYIVMFEHLFSERGLSLDRLKTLIEVARAGSIAGAAGATVRGRACIPGRSRNWKNSSAWN